MVTKDADGTWNEDLCTSGYVGYGGVGETTEWNRKTPRGQFSFTYAFGILPNPGTELSYTQVDDTYYWVDDVNSRYYNQSSRRRQHRKPGIPRSTSSRSIRLSLRSVPRLQSKLHSGCRFCHLPALQHKPADRRMHFCPGRQMITILKNVQPGCQIIIDSANGLKNY